jgi:hypothetical protein
VFEEEEPQQPTIDDMLSTPHKKQHIEAKYIIRCSQSLLDIVVFNKKADNLIKSDIMEKYNDRKRFNKYTKKISRISQVVKMLMNTDIRNSYERILRKIKKNCAKSHYLKPLVPILESADYEYKAIKVYLNPDTSGGYAIREVMDKKGLTQGKEDINLSFFNTLSDIKIGVEKLIKLNKNLINTFFADVLGDKDCGWGNKMIILKNHSKLLKK